jgi:hypothetical protein
MIRQEAGKSEAAVNKKQLSPDEKQQLWTEIQLLQNLVTSQPQEKRSKNRKGQFQKTSATSKATSIGYLVEKGYGLAENYPNRLKKFARDDKGRLQAILQRKTGNNKTDDDERKSVIEDKAFARSIFNMRHLYALNYCRKKQSEDNLYGTITLHRKNYSEGVAMFDTLSPDNLAVWEMEARSHDNLQPMIKHVICDYLRKNPKISWDALEGKIDRWCSADTIRRWLTSFDGYKTYCERVIPNSSDGQKKAHADFSRHFRNNWGLGGGKYLLIMYDEKWFWGLVTRRGAKACQELGIDQHFFQAYHKNHINKVMGIAFTAMAFEDSLDNGGSAEKLAFIRAKGKKVASRIQRKAVRQPDGNVKFCGDVIRRKGDVYDVDCAVTGSSPGTPNDPKCPLLPIFFNIIFPRVEQMVGVGGKYEGYTPVFQGDNAGPHQDATYVAGVTNYCKEKGWHWEPQAPQMPHMNVLDLSVFPCMSRRHIDKCREVGGLKVLPEDDIWENAELVWNQLPNSKIASGYIQAYRIAEKVIRAKGNNDFLGNGMRSEGIHAGVRDDFFETHNGLSGKDGKMISPPNN